MSQFAKVIEQHDTGMVIAKVYDRRTHERIGLCFFTWPPVQPEEAAPARACMGRQVGEHVRGAVRGRDSDAVEGRMTAARDPQREAFEAWFCDGKKSGLQLDHEGHYLFSDTYAAWAAWQEATRRASAREAALANGDDATGLCTVRDAAVMLLDSGEPVLEMVFVHEGRRLTVELQVPFVKPVPAAAAPQEKGEEK